MIGKNSVSPMLSPNHSQINVDVRIRGTITVSEPLVMAGQLDGDIKAGELHIASTAIVSGDVTAQNVKIDGRVHGVIVADEVYLSATAHFEGQLNCHGIAIDNGAHIDAKFIKEPVTNG